MLQDGVGGYTAARASELLELFASYAAHPLPVGELLELVGLAGAARTPVKRLSGGQQQRLSLAMALVGRPELLFLDEPTAGMDPQARRATWELIRRLRADGVSVVLTTHYLDEAEELADNVIVLNAGRVLAEGSPAELTRTGAAGRVRFSARPRLPVAELCAALPSGAQVAEPADGQYLVTAEITPQLLAAVTSWCAARGRAGRRPDRGAAQPGGGLPGAHRRRPTTRGAAVTVARTSFVPAPAAAPPGRMLAAQTRMELRLLLRNGEQVGLTLVIPLLLEFFFNLPLLYSLDSPRRIDYVVPSVLALAVISASFTGLAIGTGFERKYAVLKRLGATALPRQLLLLGKTCAVLILQLVQAILICGFGLALGWRPAGTGPGRCC